MGSFHLSSRRERVSLGRLMGNLAEGMGIESNLDLLAVQAGELVESR